MYKATCVNCMNHSYSEFEKRHCCDLSGTPVKDDYSCEYFVPDSLPDEVEEAMMKEAEAELDKMALEAEMLEKGGESNES